WWPSSCRQSDGGGKRLLRPARTKMRKSIVPRPLARGRLKNVLSLDDFETLARCHLPRPLFGYIAGAAETNASLRMNASSYQYYAFKPRVLRDVSGRSMKTELFGKEYDAPFGIAPMGISALMAYRGDLVL